MKFEGMTLDKTIIRTCMKRLLTKKVARCTVPCR